MTLSIKVFNSSSLKYLPKNRVCEAVRRTLSAEGIAVGEVNIIYMSDADICDLNNEYLGHNYATDVISFTLEYEPLLGEIYIGAETARRQSSEYGVSTTNEMMRLAVHGALHLAGYDDDTPQKRSNMRRLEDKYMAAQA